MESREEIRRNRGKTHCNCGKIKWNISCKSGRSKRKCHNNCGKTKRRFLCNYRKSKKKTQENKGAVWENNQNSKENPRQSTEKVIDKTQKKTVEKTNGTSVEETQSAKEKTGRARNAEQTFERSPQKKTESVENTKSSRKCDQQQEGRIHPEI